MSEEQRGSPIGPDEGFKWGATPDDQPIDDTEGARYTQPTPVANTDASDQNDVAQSDDTEGYGFRWNATPDEPEGDTEAHARGRLATPDEPADDTEGHGARIP